jgi:hypothetical protein
MEAACTAKTLATSPRTMWSNNPRTELTPIINHQERQKYIIDTLYEDVRAFLYTSFKTNIERTETYILCPTLFCKSYSF